MGRCHWASLLPDIISFICISAILGQDLCFSHPELTLGSPQGVAVVWRLLDCSYSSLSRVSLGSPWRADDCDILVYWQGRKYFISYFEKWYPRAKASLPSQAPALLRETPKSEAPRTRAKGRAIGLFQAMTSLGPSCHCGWRSTQIFFSFLRQAVPSRITFWKLLFWKL